MKEQKRQMTHLTAFASAGAMLFGGLGSAAAQAPLDRTILPLPEPAYPHSTVLDARDATPPPRFEVKTPEVADPTPLQMERSILVEIDKDAQVYLDHKPVVIEDIGPAVALARQSLPEAPVLIEADGRVAYEVPLQVMDQIRQAGVTTLSLVTQKSQEPPAQRPAAP